MQPLIQALLDKTSHLTKEEKNTLHRAFDFAAHAHTSQMRATGEPYITHPIAVCEILLSYQADITTLVSALLHDVVEDTPVTIKEIHQFFGTTVGSIVEGLTKIEKGKHAKEEYSAINTEKLLSASAQDCRVAVIKLADRLHNMRTLAVKRIEKKVSYANETAVFFAPLAEKLGLYKLQEELEDISFQYLNPRKYAIVQKLMDNYELIFQASFGEITNNRTPLIVDVVWKRLPIYKSYSLLQEDIHLSELFTIHIITNSTIDCYTTLGEIHAIYSPADQLMQDGIAVTMSPFQKYLTTKVTIHNTDVKVCIGTTKTRELQECGVFALMKEMPVKQVSEMLFATSIQEAKETTDTPVEWGEVVAHELFGREINIFTPRMDMVTLPEGATIVDFAFALDPSRAKRMRVAKVNGDIVALDTHLSNMDIVELQLEEQESVKAEWVNYVKTAKAMREISVILEDK